MEWFLIALIAPALWGITNYLDKYLIDKYFKGGGVGAIMGFSAIAGLILLPIVFVFTPEVLNISLSSLVIILLSGVLLTIGFWPYYYALRDYEASSAVPIFQSIPIFSFLLGYFFLGENISIIQFLGMVAIIVGSVGLSLDLSCGKITFESKLFWLMIVSSCTIALSMFAFKFVAVDDGYGISIFWSYVGSIVSVLPIILFVKLYREQFISVFKNNKVAVISLNLINEILDLSAHLVIKFALLMAPIALVMTVNGFQPFFVLLFGVLLSVFFPRIIKENVAQGHLLKKLTFIAIIFIGAYFLII